MSPRHDRDPAPFVVATFYRFVPVAEPGVLRDLIHAKMAEASVVGTILLAEEGINGTICGERTGLDTVLAFLRSFPAFEELPHQESFHRKPTFSQIKVKVKPEIVTMGFPSVHPASRTGTHVSSEEWNRLLQDPEVVLVDTRNEYEVRVGTFEGAIDPRIRTFQDFPRYVRETFDPATHKKVAMFCTGGIRCEKASAFMLQEGFEEVYQLKGGILAYLRETSPEDSLWRGDCFVFDERVGVKPSLEASELVLCSSCGEPLKPHEVEKKATSEDQACPFCPPSRP